jgi:hypothetical protein
VSKRKRYTIRQTKALLVLGRDAAIAKSIQVVPQTLLHSRMCLLSQSAQFLAGSRHGTFFRDTKLSLHWPDGAATMMCSQLQDTTKSLWIENEHLKDDFTGYFLRSLQQ